MVETQNFLWKSPKLFLEHFPKTMILGNYQQFLGLQKLLKISTKMGNHFASFIIREKCSQMNF